MHSLPGIEEPLFVIDHVMDETPPEPLIGPVDIDSPVIDGEALLHKKVNRALLMDHNQLQQSRGEVELIPPPLAQVAVFIAPFGECEIMQQVHVDWVTLLLVSNFHIKDTIVYIIKSSLKSNVRCYINLIAVVELDRFQQLTGGPGWQ